MRKNKSENLLDYCVFYKDRELPAIQKNENFKKAMLLDSIQNHEHPLNQFIQKKQTFVPYINERDNMGKLITSELTHRKKKSETSSLFHSPKNSNFFLSKNSIQNSISNTCSVYENYIPSTKLKLKNLLGGTPENTQILQQSMSTEFKLSFQQHKQLRISHKKNLSLQNKIPLIKQITPNILPIRQPNTPLATRIYQSNFIIEMFNKNKISNQKLSYILLIEKISTLQIEFLKGLSSQERRKTYIKIGNKKVQLSLLLLIPKQTQYRMLQ